MTAPDQTRRADPSLLTLSEAALLVVHLVVVGGFARLYADGSFFWSLAGFVVVAHTLAVVLRRRHARAPIVLAVALIGAALTATWLLFASTTTFALPTTGTWTAMGDALRVGRDAFSRVFAPTEVTPGFQLVAGLALYGAVWFADWAAFRLRATAEALVPAGILFVFCAELGSGSYQIISAVAFTGAMLAFVAAHRALRAETDLAWLSSSRRSGARSVLRFGAAMAVIGLVAGAVIGPQLPGSDAEALVRLRSGGSGAGNRSTISPIVDLRKRLVNQTDTVLFTVRAEHGSYWRLTALDRFDGQIWKSDGQFPTAGEGRLPADGPQIAEGRRNRQEFDIRTLSAIWAPTAYQPQRLLSTTSALGWDPESSTLIVQRNADSDGLDYRVVSETPIIDPEVLARSRTSRGGVARRYRELPDDFPDVVRETARRVTASSDSRYTKALALQQFFRNDFTYSLDIDPGHSDDALVDFLDSRRGYCEQFAGAYAAMARSLGIPARVAVGFTPGDRDPKDPELFTVRGRHAHAWPEVWFPEFGWVPFEPTPGRGNPDGEAYTGVASQQDETRPGEGPGGSTTTVPAITPVTPAPPATPPASIQPDRQVVAGAGPTVDEGAPGSWGPVRRLAVGLALAALAFVLAVLVAPVLRRRRSGDRSPAATVLDAWQRSLAPIRWLATVAPEPAETHVEFAHRAATVEATLDPSLAELARLATRAAWDPAAPTVDQVERAEALAEQLHDEADRRQGPLTRLRRRLSWREAFDRPRPPAPRR